MIKYERINISERIDVNKTNKSKQCKFCYYWCFLHKKFSYGPYICDDCCNFFQKSRDFKNITIVHIKKIHTKFSFHV